MHGTNIILYLNTIILVIIVSPTNESLNSIINPQFILKISYLDLNIKIIFFSKWMKAFIKSFLLLQNSQLSNSKSVESLCNNKNNLK